MSDNTTKHRQQNYAWPKCVHINIKLCLNDSKTSTFSYVSEFMWVILRNYVTTGKEKIGFNCNRGAQHFQYLRAV